MIPKKEVQNYLLSDTEVERRKQEFIKRIMINKKEKYNNRALFTFSFYLIFFYLKLIIILLMFYFSKNNINFILLLFYFIEDIFLWNTINF